MNQDQLIPLKLICDHYKIEISFIQELVRYELIQVEKNDTIDFISMEQIKTIEKMNRLHHDLGINFEGLDVVTNLLDKIEALEKQIFKLQNRIDFYE